MLTTIDTTTQNELNSIDKTQSNSKINSKVLEVEYNHKKVGYWMLFMGGLVVGIVVIGGLTRLTESGLSIVEWNLIKGIKPPMNPQEWEAEFEKYKQYPEFKKLNQFMDIEEFKFIFFMEWLHRVWGRAIGIAFIVPAIIFYKKKMMTKQMAKRCLTLGALIGFQGALGWYMVKSGLSEELMKDPNAVPRVSQYRLASHLGAAFLLFSGFLVTGLEILKDNKFNLKQQKRFLDPLLDPKLQRFRSFSLITLSLVSLTALSGAFVAGLDAGMIYNSFPYMGDSIIPPSDEMWSPLYSNSKNLEVLPNGSNPDGMWRNIFDNPTTVQFNHRLLATTTFSTILALYIHSRKLILPPRTRMAVNAMMAISLLQVSLGISTLLYLVPVPLAAAHQSGSLALLSSNLYLVHLLRRLPK
ncbi:cytochrome oxidase assembly [Neoconidiobolus thromboides FSU 785]|nr:cytochrome oxidase assembly [Neoconidiobolus thromboides FSU 785]